MSGDIIIFDTERIRSIMKSLQGILNDAAWDTLAKYIKELEDERSKHIAE